MSTARDDLRVDGARLRRSLEMMAEIGATAGGGMHRLALSDDDRRARDLLVSWLRDLEAQVERTSWEDCEAGANVLLQCVLASADEPLSYHPAGAGDEEGG